MSRYLVISMALVAGCRSNVAVGERGKCDAYLDCLAETDPETFEAEIEIYGNSGSCFDGASVDDCETACVNKLEALGESDEACEPPPEPGDEPPVDADGYVDCAAIRSGPTVGPGEPGPTGFPDAACNPRASGMGEWTCCSDDPATAGAMLPAYQGNVSSGGTPLFSGLNNALGTWGLCVKTDDIPAASGLAEPAAAGCPIPCNPTWEDADREMVCGQGRACCQTRQLQPEDCILDDNGRWRPAIGGDVLDGRSSWAPAEHATHQDPNGRGCASLAGSSDADDPDFEDCIEQLTVADQRGYCMALQPGQACPVDAPDYLDACEMINAGMIPPPR